MYTLSLIHIFGKKVYTFFEDAEHRIWLGTRNHGIVVATEKEGAFTLQNFRHDARNPYSLSNDAIYTICQDTRNRIWIGTLGGGINLFTGFSDNSRFIHPGNLLREYPDGLCHKVRSLHCTLAVSYTHLINLSLLRHSERSCNRRRDYLYKNCRQYEESLLYSGDNC